jgi:hypothetical protein
MLGVQVEVELEVAHRVPTIGQTRELLIHLVPWRLQDLEQTALGLLVQGLDKPNTLAGRDLLLVVASEGENALPNNHLEMLLSLLPVADIAPINPDRHGAIRDGKCGPISRASLDKGPLLLAQFVFTALGHRECMVLNGGRYACDTL